MEERSIEDWCKVFNIMVYEIINDKVNVKGYVSLFKKNYYENSYTF